MLKSGFSSQSRGSPLGTVFVEVLLDLSEEASELPEDGDEEELDFDKDSLCRDEDPLELGGGGLSLLRFSSWTVA